MSPKALLLSLFFCSTSPSAFAFFCGTHSVMEGQSMYQIQEWCGRPGWQNSRTASISRPVFNRNWVGPPSYETIQVQVDEWVYDMGSTRSMQKLVFQDGVLVSILSLGYGGK